MQKAYNRINWENYPSDRTPLNETNLNKLDVGVNELDNRIITLDNTKFDKTEASQLIKNFELDKATGIITVTYLSGATATIDTMLEKLAVNFDFDKTSQKLVIVLDDGTVKEIDLTALITEYEFKSTDTVAFSVDADGKVAAIIKEGSIQEKHLRPDYLADIRVEVAKAELSENNAETSAIKAESFAVGGTNTRTDEDTDNAKFYYEASKQIFNDFENVGTVLGVKGDNESDYRTGNVNITAENIGLGNVDNTADKDKNVKHAESATQDGNGNNIPDTYATKQSLIDNFNNYGYWGSGFFNSNDVNTWIKVGIYCTIAGQYYNLPSQIDGWSTVLVLAGNGANDRITQICWGWNDASYTLYKRGTGNSGANWSDWVAIVDEGNITRCITPNKIGAVESRKITEPTDFNQFQETGMFYINFLGASNQPVYAHGLLIVNFDIGTPFHIFIPDTVNAIVKRNWHGTYWSDWYNAIDTLYNKGTITTNSQILNTATAIEASTSDDNIVGAKGLKEYINSNKNITYTASPNSSGYAEISNIDVSKFSYFVAVNVVVGNAGSKGIGRMVFAKSDDVWFYKATASTYSGNANELTSSISPMYNNLIKIGCNANATIICSIESGF